MKIFLKWFLRFLFFLLWLVFSVLSGALFLSVKEAVGINVFSSTGYHAFKSCLVHETYKAFHEEK
ncbi:MAG TPA: hypothetical protein DD400_03875 [Rhodospirillaceae bacterium]|nr:hypothetical protein [Rhodospirillaceae bacterium]